MSLPMPTDERGMTARACTEPDCAPGRTSAGAALVAITAPRRANKMHAKSGM